VPPAGPAVEAHDNFFQDASQADASDHSVSITTGDSVRFSYPSGKSSHNVKFTADAPTCKQTAGTVVPGFAVPPLPAFPVGPGWVGECQFAKAGVYDFVCSTHPTEMSGSILVADPGQDPPPAASPTPTVQAATPTPAPFTRDLTPAPKPRAWASQESPLGSELKVARLAAGKLVLVAHCASAGSGKLSLAVTKSVARRLKLKSTTLATAKAACDGHGRFTVTVKPSLNVRRALRHTRAALKVTATLKLVGPSGQTSTKRSLTLEGRS